MKPQPIYLEWCDAVTNPGWFTRDEAEAWSETDWVIRECGWLIKETKEYVVFATGWKIEDENCHEKFCSMHKIPKTWIRKRKLLKI